VTSEVMLEANLDQTQAVSQIMEVNAEVKLEVMLEVMLEANQDQTQEVFQMLEVNAEVTSEVT
jgi:hypothetical protein